MMCAMILPPKAGRIWDKSVFSSISRIVQSAVRPVFIRAATRGASCLRPWSHRENRRWFYCLDEVFKNCRVRLDLETCQFRCIIDEYFIYIIMKQFVCSRFDFISHKQGVNRMSRYLGKFSRFSKKLQCNRMHLSIHVIYVNGNAFHALLSTLGFTASSTYSTAPFGPFSHAETAHLQAALIVTFPSFSSIAPNRTELDKFLIIRDFVLMYD